MATIAGAHFGSGDDGAGGIGDGAAKHAGVFGGSQKERRKSQEEERERDGSAKARKAEWIHYGELRASA